MIRLRRLYLIAGAEQIDTAELGLSNLNGPVLEEERGFTADQQSWKARHVGDANVVDFRSGL